jgi:acyl dehydratase
VQSTARKNVGARDEAVVMTWQRKVDVFKRDPAGRAHPGEAPPDAIACELWLPPYDPSADYKSMAHLSSPDSYFEDFTPGTRIEHSRGRTMTSEHIHLTAVLDNTSQVHCNQFMIDQDPDRYVGGQLIVFGGIPFTLCLGLSSPDVGDNALGDIAYPTGRHTAPLFAGDTVFAATEIRACATIPAAPISASSRRRSTGTSSRGRGARRRARTRRPAGRRSDLRARAPDRGQAAQPLRLDRPRGRHLLGQERERARNESPSTGRRSRAPTRLLEQLRVDASGAASRAAGATAPRRRSSRALRDRAARADRRRDVRDRRRVA